MNMINKGIPYFPTPANFFDEEVMELLEAKFGVLASYIVMRLLCKIYKEGYYISWGKEQNLIFVRKVGGGIKEDMMEKIVDLLLEKGFFHKETYDTKENRFLPTTLFIRDQEEKRDAKRRVERGKCRHF